MLDAQEILLIRHGQSTANASGVWQGQLNFPLSDEGREQARLAGRSLAGMRISGVYASPLSRAFETARIISREAGFDGEIMPHPGLMERHGGILEGTTRTGRLERNPELVDKLSRLPEEERWALVNAETDEDILARFAEALSAIRLRHGPGDKFLVVSHGGVMRAFLRDLFGPDVLSGDERAPNTSITRVAWNSKGESPQLLELASTDHLSSTPGTTSSE